MSETPLPSWASSMVSNYRATCGVPASVRDVTLFAMIEDLRGCEQTEIEQAIREELGSDAPTHP